VSPVASFTATPMAGDAPLVVDFDAVASSDEWGIATYLWDFDNSDGIQVEATSVTPQNTFSVADSYVVTLRVQDNSGLFAQTTKQINVNDPANQPPTASASANPRAGAAPFQVQFAGSGTDPDGGGVTYFWDFDNGDTENGPSPLYTYVSGTPRGSYEVVLTVTDDESASVQDSVFVTVTQEAPEASGEVNPAAETTITVNDGSSAIDGAQVVVPVGASADPIVVSIGTVPEGNDPAPPAGAVSEVIELGPEGATLDPAVTVRIPLNATVSDPDQLAVAGYDESAGYWSTEGLSNVQFVDAEPVDFVTAETGHFSFFVALLPPSGEDIDRNGSVNAIDVQLVINGALGLTLPPGTNTDVDGNGSTNAIDVQRVINAALGL
jgi:PKD repeat protein